MQTGEAEIFRSEFLGPEPSMVRVEIDHEGNRVSSPEEADEMAALIEEMLDGGISEEERRDLRRDHTRMLYMGFTRAGQRLVVLRSGRWVQDKKVKERRNVFAVRMKRRWKCPMG